MKQQVLRLSPHQNGKVFAVMMAVSSLVFFVPFFVVMSLAGPKDPGPGLWFFMAMPVFYLVFGYVMIVISCWFYNLLVKVVGGIEFETGASEA